jgi:hypothetical protein
MFSDRDLGEADVAYGSNSDLSQCLRHVRFTPRKGICWARLVMSQKGHYRTHAVQQNVFPLVAQLTERGTVNAVVGGSTSQPISKRPDRAVNSRQDMD